jgi:gluconolactonase
MALTSFDARFGDIFDADARPEGMPGGYDIGGGDTAGWGRGCDGPVWAPELGAITFTDVAHHRRLVWAGDGDVKVLEEGTGGASGSARDAEGRFVNCEWWARRLTRQEKDGSVTVLAEAFEGTPFNRPDDVVVATDGTIFFTDLKVVMPPPGPGWTDRSAVYRLVGGTATRIDADVEHPGGLGLSPDGATLYVSDTRRGRVMAYPAGGGVGRVFTALKGEGEGAPHGMAVDVAGNVYIGGPGGLWVIGPDGKPLGVLPLTASRVTNCAFGGMDGATLYITTPVGIGRVRTRVKGPTPAAGVASPAVLRKPELTQRIERLDPALDAIVSPDATIANLGSGGFIEDLGGGPNENYARSLEGTFYSAEDRCFYFSDIGNNRRMRWTPERGIEFGHAPTGHTNGATLDLQGRIVSAEHSGRRLSVRDRDGTRRTLADKVDGKRFNRPNDVVVRSDGDMFFTNPWWDFGSGEAGEIGFAGVYHVTADLKTVTLIGRDYRVPNGLAFSPDEKILYVNDSYGTDESVGPVIRAYDVRPDGSIDAGSVRDFARLRNDSREGKPDGMKVDQAGNVYCGGSGGLWILDSSGKHLGTIVHGHTQTNNLCFGGPDWKTLFFVSWISVHSVPLLTPGIPIPARKPA